MRQGRLWRFLTLYFEDGPIAGHPRKLTDLWLTLATLSRELDNLLHLLANMVTELFHLLKLLGVSHGCLELVGQLFKLVEALFGRVYHFLYPSMCHGHHLSL